MFTRFTRFWSSDNFPVSSKSVGRGRGEREEERKSGALVGGLTAMEKRKLVSQYGDLSNDEDDDLYPPQMSVVEFMNHKQICLMHYPLMLLLYCTHVCQVKDVVKSVQE